jgi:hypothetical protein
VLTTKTEDKEAVEAVTSVLLSRRVHLTPETIKKIVDAVDAVRKEQREQVLTSDYTS